MKRRNFIKTSAVITAGGMMAPGFALGADETKYLSTLAVAKGSRPAAMTRAAVEALGGMSQFVPKGSKVLVKPNIGWDRLPIFAANTNPDVVGEVVRMVLEAGAKEVLVFDRTCNDPRRCYKSSGIAAAAKEAGAKVKQIDNRKFVKTAFPQGVALKEWEVYKDYLDADVYINVPIAKHHSLAKVTMCMKNHMGLLGGDRGKLHWGIEERMVDWCTLIKPQLNILDAYRVMTQNGPSGGSPADTALKNTIIAGTDQVTVDAYGSTLFGYEPTDLEYIKLAHQRKVGNADLSKTEIREVKV